MKASFEKVSSGFSLKVFPWEDRLLQKPESFLNVSEGQYWRSLTHPKRKDQFLQSRFFLKQELEKILKVPAQKIAFTSRGEGKLVLDSDSKLSFNISHTDAFLAVVWSESCEVGVDIEKIRWPENSREVMKKVFLDTEVQYVEGGSSDQEKARRFSRLWSGKEAVINAAAGGVFKHAKSVELGGEPLSLKKLPEDFQSLSNWKTEFFEEVADHVVCVAIQKLSLKPAK